MSVRRRSFRFLMLASILGALFFAAQAAASVNYWNNYIHPNTREWSGWNYWGEEDTSKGCYCNGGVGLNNGSKEVSVIDTSGYDYIDITYGVGGYLRGFSLNAESSFDVWYDSDICTC